MPINAQSDSGEGYTYNPATGQVTLATSSSSLPPGVTQAQVDASLAANPNASKGGYEGSTVIGDQYPGQTSLTTKTPGSAVDWAQILGMYGLPPDIAQKVSAIFAQTSDVSQASQLALAYIRGTTWYDQTYPGIKEGLKNGTVSNEADYRHYLNDVNILSKQYLGRDISGSELAGFLGQGYNVDRIGRIWQGGAIAQTNGQDWRYATGAFDENGPLNADETAALGQEQAGIDTALGQRVQRRLALAQQRLQSVFNGQAATAGLSTSGGRLTQTTLGGSDIPDIAA